MRNSIYKIKYLLFLSWGLGGVVFDCLGGNTPPPERNIAWNKGRKCFHCLGAPNNLIRPWSRLQGNSGGGRIMSMTYSSDPIRTRTRDLPACSAVPTSPPLPSTDLSQDEREGRQNFAVFPWQPQFHPYSTSFIFSHFTSDPGGGLSQSIESSLLVNYTYYYLPSMNYTVSWRRSYY